MYTLIYLYNILKDIYWSIYKIVYIYVYWKNYYLRVIVDDKKKTSFFFEWKYLIYLKNKSRSRKHKAIVENNNYPHQAELSWVR